MNLTEWSNPVGEVMNKLLNSRAARRILFEAGTNAETKSVLIVLIGRHHRVWRRIDPHKVTDHRKTLRMGECWH